MNTMENAVWEFIENFSFSDKYKFLLEHYNRGEHEAHLIKAYLSTEYLFYNITLSSEVSHEIIEKIKKWENNSQFLEDAADIYKEDLVLSIQLFWNWIDDFWTKEDFFPNIARGQFIAYGEAIDELQREFISYLESKI